MAVAGTCDLVILAADARAAAYRREVERTDRLGGRMPGERMVEPLAQGRAAGTPFEEAWPRCVRLPPPRR